MVQKSVHDRPDPDLPSRPTKRPRTTLIGPPDGFSEPEPQPKPKIAYKPPANVNFKSMFETTAAPNTGASSVAKKSSKGASRLVTSGAFARLDTPERDVSAASKTGKSSLVRPLKLPMFATPSRPQAKANPDQKQSTESAMSIFRRIHPVSLAASPSKAPSEPSKPKSLRPAPAPPLLMPPSDKPQPLLKPLPPPPFPSPSKKGKEKETPQSYLRTISTTHIALATDLTSQAGSASLLSIFLQDNKPDVGLTGGREEEKEVKRGIGVSPVKGAGKGRGFIRNGLAERASNLLSRSQTAFTLWHKETSSLHLTATLSRRPSADLHLHILKILHEPSPFTYSHSRSTTTARPIIALCRVIKKPQNESEEGLTDDIYPVLFSSPIPSNFNPVEGFEEGGMVYVWKPWHVVELPQPEISVGYDIYDDAETPVAQQTDRHDAMVRRTKYVLLCARFLFR